MDKKSKQQVVKSIREKLKITKVVVTRTIKSRDGDLFVGFSAAWDSIQEDIGPGTDLSDTLTEAEKASSISRGMSIAEAKIASYLLAAEVEETAINRAQANGAPLTQEYSVPEMKLRYARLISRLLGDEANDG